VKIGLFLHDINTQTLRLAKQIGVSDIVANAPGTDRPRWSWRPPRSMEPDDPIVNYEALLHDKEQVSDAGLTWAVIESLRIPDRVKFACEGRDEDIENWCKSLRNIGAAGIPIVCYNWTAVHSWIRTSTSKRVRGGALSTAYDHTLMENAPITEAGPLSEETLWEALEYFLKAVVPIAEEANVKLAMHPDDPPLSPLRGIGRIMISPESFQRLIDMVPSPNNGITFCQGCFSEMGCEIPETLKQFCNQDKVFFAHFRNLRGTATDFYETFHDDGDVDMYAVMKAFYDVGFQYPIRPDHVPTLEGDDHSQPGYSLLGKLHAVGFMRGLMTAIEHTM